MYFYSHEFCYSKVDEKESAEPLFTHLILLEPSEEEGVFQKRHVVVETQLNALQGLSFTDFSLTKLLASGVSLKSLQISKDLRLGYDADIDSYNKHLEDIASELFVQPSNE